MKMFKLLLLVMTCSISAFAKEVALLDTKTAISDLVGWQMTENGWTDVTTHDADLNEIRALQVCGILKSNQNNWLRTPFLPVSEANGIVIEMWFTIRSCNDLSSVLSCKETFNLYYLESDTDSETSPDMLNDKVYSKINTVAAEERFQPGQNRGVTNIERRMIGPFRKNGVYIAFQDTGACMSLLRVKVYYNTCDGIVRNLATFPETTTSYDLGTLVPVTGECVIDAAWTIDNKGPILRCNSKGQWNLPNDGSCRCREGYEPNHGSTRCEECPIGQYKLEMGNVACSTCPDNSMSVKRGSTSCICSANYYRSPQDDPNSPCTMPPSRPTDLSFEVNKTIVILRWNEPIYSSRSDLSYRIACQECDETFSLCSDCSSGVDYFPSQEEIVDTMVRISDLSPHTHYKFKVFSKNGVSDVTRRPNKYAMITLKTNEAAPTMIDRIHVGEVTPHTALLSWKPPQRANGNILEYEVHYTSGSRKEHGITRSNRTKNNIIIISGLSPNTAFIARVRARNAAGYGLYSPPVKFVTSGVGPSMITVTENKIETGADDAQPGLMHQGSGSQLHLVVGIAVACSLIILVIVALLFICERKKRPYKTPVIMGDYPAFFNTLDLVNTRKTYVDPSTYEDPEEAVHVFANEIDSSFIKIEQVIGSGEFGEVCKGILRPPTPVGEEEPFAMSPQQRAVVAIKTLKSGYTQQQKKDFLSEASIMGQFNHPNVIRLEGVITKNRPFMIVTEFMENGSLDTFLMDATVQPPMLQLIEMLREIACGMRYLADMGYVHRDLAARNILVDANLICKVSDFGLSRELGSTETDQTAMYTTRGGMIPIRWTAPEAITKREFTSASDVWSYGIVIWEVLSKGERPYWEMSNKDVHHCVDCGYRLPPPPFCPLLLHGIMLDCWDAQRNERPTFTDLMVSMDNCLRDPHNLQNTINNIPHHQQVDCIPETLDLSSLGQWLEGMNMTHLKDNMLRHGCVTAEQITRLCPSQLNLMGIYDKRDQNIVLDGSQKLLKDLENVQNIGVAV